MYGILQPSNLRKFFFCKTCFDSDSSIIKFHAGTGTSKKIDHDAFFPKPHILTPGQKVFVFDFKEKKKFKGEITDAWLRSDKSTVIYGIHFDHVSRIYLYREEAVREEKFYDTVDNV